jgi:hypothetical protein
VAATLVTHRHGKLGFEIDLPAGAEIDEATPGVALIAAERTEALGPGDFRPNFTVVAEELPEPLDLAAYVATSLASQAEALEGFRLLDREEVEIAGRPAVRTLCHHRLGDAFAVVAEQWRLVDGTRGWVLTGSSDALGYDQVADVMAQAATSLVLPGRPA